MFKKVTKFIVNQADPSKELVPVESIADHEHFRLFCLLIKRRKPKTIFHPAPYYRQTGFRLDDVLLPGEDGESTESLLCKDDDQETTELTLVRLSADQVDGDLNICADPASVELKGRGSSLQEFSITLHKTVTSLQSLEAVRRKRQINMDHSFIQQLQQRHFNLYVVYETLETSEEAIYKESTTADGAFKAKIYATFSAKGTRDNKQGIIIPKGCTLAFRAIQLHIGKGEWELEFLSGAGAGIYEDDGPPQGKLQIVMEEVKAYCAIFSELSSGLLIMFLNTFTAVMRDRNLFQELSQKMENVLEETDGYKLKTKSSALKDLLNTLKNSRRTRRFQLAEGITYTLDALAELLEAQLLLLLESLEKKIVSQQLKLVGKLLENELEKGNEPFHVDASLLSFPGQEEQSLTMALVELSGVKLQEDGSAVPMDQPFEAVAALYVALYILNLLSGSE